MSGGKKVRRAKLRLKPRSLLELPIKFKPRAPGRVHQCPLQVRATPTSAAAPSERASAGQPPKRAATLLSCDAVLMGESSCST